MATEALGTPSLLSSARTIRAARGSSSGAADRPVDAAISAIVRALIITTALITIPPDSRLRLVRLSAPVMLIPAGTPRRASLPQHSSFGRGVDVTAKGVHKQGREN